MRGSGGAAPRKKLHFLYQKKENFVKYFVLNVNKMPSITVEWNEDNIFMLLKIPLYEGGGVYYTFFPNLQKIPYLRGGIIKQKVQPCEWS